MTFFFVGGGQGGGSVPKGEHMVQFDDTKSVPGSTCFSGKLTFACVFMKVSKA